MFKLWISKTKGRKEWRQSSFKLIKLSEPLSLGWHFGVYLNCWEWTVSWWKREQFALAARDSWSFKSNFNLENAYGIVVFSISMVWEWWSQRMSSVPQGMRRIFQFPSLWHAGGLMRATQGWEKHTSRVCESSISCWENKSLPSNQHASRQADSHPTQA